MIRFPISGMAVCRPPRNGQQGMALLIALIVLVVVSMLGVVSMRTALFQNRVSINNQVATLTFQAAESGLNDTMALAIAQAHGPNGIDEGGLGDDVDTSGPNHLFGQAVNDESRPRRVCMTEAGVPVVDVNHGIRIDNDEVDFTEPCDPLPGAAARTTTMVSWTTADADMIQGSDVGGQEQLAVQIRAEGDIPGTNIRSIHVEKWWTQAPTEQLGGG